MPTLLGRRYEINPFLIFLAIVFWGWMWGPVGAILAVPLLVTAQTVRGRADDGAGPRRLALKPQSVLRALRSAK